MAAHTAGHLINAQILDSTGDAIYALDPDWRVVFFNRQAERFFERDRKELLGRTIWDCFPAAKGAELGVALERAMQDRESIQMDVLSPTTGRWTNTRIFPLANGGVAASWRDITTDKRREIELAAAVENQDRAVRELRTIIDHVPAMVAYWDRDLTCRFANEKYLEWFGRRREEMVGLTIQSLMGEDLFRKNEPFIRGALAGKPQSFERSLRKPSGEVGHTWAQYVPDVDDRGVVQGFYAMVTDVSPLKQTEERLREANAALEVARKAAEAATSAKSAFVSNVSHELRNPLTAIIGYAELLAKHGGMDDTQQRYLARVHDASTALLTTINEVLDFSKLEAGQVEIMRRPTDPLALGRQTLEMFEPAMDKKGLAHGFEVVDAPALVLADDARLRQILVNLIGNAVKFTASGSVSLRCSYDRRARTLRYEVIDTGPGIPADRLDRLFQRFSQLDASTSQAFGGTGLGLAISKGLAEAMGGDMGVLSIAGEGSCFWVEIPCELADARARSQEPAGETLAPTDELRGLRLLVVDDDPSNRELVSKIVEPFGVIVAEAGGGGEAVAAARSDPFDVILMDIRMPGIDGPTAAQLIRAHPGRNASTPILAFTAEATPSAPQPWRGQFDATLEKPIVSADLLAQLAAHSAKVMLRKG
jgi:PAS domain S-box-containing protein